MNILMIASSSQERLNSWRQGLSNIANAFLIKEKIINNRLDVLREDVVSGSPQILLLDVEILELDGSCDVIGLGRLCAEAKTIVMSGEISEDLEWELLKSGIRGFCPNDIDPEILKHAIESVERGELWIRRSLTARLIDELGKTSVKIKTHQPALGLLSKLTQREYDIAERVGKGECNKQIAQACDITERTVKAHLTEIFHKLGVADRLNLALVLAADNRIYIENAGATLTNGSRIYELNSAGCAKHLPTSLVA